MQSHLLHPHLATRGLVAAAVKRDLSQSLRGAEFYPLVYRAVPVYLVAAGVISVASGASFGIPFVVAALLVVAGWFWVAPRLVWILGTTALAVALFFGLDGFSDRASQITHVTAPIDFEKWLTGGGSFVVWAQTTFLANPLHYVLSPFLVAAYMSLWFGPLLAAYWLWTRHSDWLGRFATGFLLLECVGFLLYFLFPETPPWLASQQGYLPALHREVVNALTPFFGLGRDYANSDPAPLSAMPAMHVAVPMLVGWVMFAVSRGHRFAWAWFLYPLSVATAVLVFAEHYLIDVLVAVLLGTLAFWVSQAVFRRRPRLIEARHA